MRVVNLTSFKGGAGKTTATMALTSALIEKGMKVALIDADENRPLLAWEETARTNGFWNDRCSVAVGDDMGSLMEAYGQAEAAGTDIAILDTRGGGSELNNACMVNSSIVLVPSALTGLDITAALSTFEYAVKLLHDAGSTVPARLLIQRVPMGRLSRSQENDMELISTLPRCETVLHQRDAFASMSKRGLLHPVVRATAENPKTRIAASTMWAAVDEARQLADEIVSIIDGGS